jgi:hypothetical protein
MSSMTGVGLPVLTLGKTLTSVDAGSDTLGPFLDYKIVRGGNIHRPAGEQAVK